MAKGVQNGKVSNLNREHKYNSLSGWILCPGPQTKRTFGTTAFHRIRGSNIWRVWSLKSPSLCPNSKVPLQCTDSVSHSARVGLELPGQLKATESESNEMWTSRTKGLKERPPGQVAPEVMNCFRRQEGWLTGGRGEGGICLLILSTFNMLNDQHCLATFAPEISRCTCRFYIAEF